MDRFGLVGDEGATADEAGFMQVLGRREDPDLLLVARRIIAWAGERSLPLRWGLAYNVPLFTPVVPAGGGEYSFVEITAKGRVDLLFDKMAEAGPFQDEEKRLEIIRRLNLIPGMGIPDFTARKRPNFSLNALASDPAFALFADTFDWVIEQAKGE